MKALNSKKQETQANDTTSPEKRNEVVGKTVTCRYCKTNTLIKAKPKNFIETQIFPLLRISPYRCTNCKRRDYYFERG
jgi:DNA-directed RNA polymerase subunit RPC12/RpoP